MAKTAGQIDIELFLYQCCVADLAIKYINREIMGSQDIDCLYQEVLKGSLLIEQLKCHRDILAQECLTQTEIEDNLEKINNICDCIACDREDLLDDTLPTALSNLIIDNNGGFIRYT